MELNPCVEDLLSAAHFEDSSAFLFGASKVLESVAEVAFGATARRPAAAPTDVVAVRGEKFLEEVVHPKLRKAIEKAAADKDGFRLVNVKVKQASLVSAFVVYKFGGTPVVSLLLR